MTSETLRLRSKQRSAAHIQGLQQKTSVTATKLSQQLAQEHLT
ncbi:MAG TPA: hypothetical protein QF700_09240 [Prochlorococcus sp.]|nr:hypothetical protein [Prochlorococcus sp.]